MSLFVAHSTFGKHTHTNKNIKRYRRVISIIHNFTKHVHVYSVECILYKTAWTSCVRGGVGETSNVSTAAFLSSWEKSEREERQRRCRFHFPVLLLFNQSDKHRLFRSFSFPSTAASSLFFHQIILSRHHHQFTFLFIYLLSSKIMIWLF